MEKIFAKVLLIDRIARWKAASGYTLNSHLQIETQILEKQIEALEQIAEDKELFAQARKEHTEMLRRTFA